MGKSCPSCGREARDDSRFCPYDGTPLGGGAPREPLAGVLVAGRYRISRTIGQGGMARVYLAHHAGIGVDVAFKVLNPELGDDPQFVARLAREAHAVARLDHPNIVGVIDFGQGALEDGSVFHYLVMEYVNGRPLDTELERVGPMPPERAAHVLSQIAAGIGNAHARSIVHRDLKPANIMLRQRGSEQDFVTILDFGLSRSIVPDADMPQLTGSTQIVGTPYYMAPEQWGPGAVDVRSDIYAIGVIGYELLTGELPFSGPVASILYKAIHEEPPPPSERVEGGVHPPLEAVVMRCMAKSPDDRFQDVEALLVSLGEAWRTLPRRAGRRTTYAATSAAPPPPGTDELPDPTVWQSKQVDALEDGPSIVSEIGRLLQLRRRHLAELAGATWPAGPPPRVAALRHDIDRLERAIEQHGTEVAVLEASIEEFDQQIREQEAELRAQIVRANVELTMPKGVWTTPTDDFDREQVLGLAATLPGNQPPAADIRLRQAERSLASLHRSQLKEQLTMRETMTERIGAMRGLEAQLDVLYEELGTILDAAVPRGSALQPALVAFQRLDGAIAAYKGLLASFDDGAR